jgi:histidinol dehydrogenase
MPRQQVIRAALENRGALIQVRDLDEACRIANRIAPNTSNCRSTMPKPG